MTARTIIFAIAIAAAITPADARAQQPPLSLSREALITLAAVQVQISARQDSINPQLAHPRNKKDESQVLLQTTLKREIAAVLAKHGLTDAEYRRQTFVVSTDPRARRIFDSTVVAITGTPLPGYTANAPAGGAASVELPPGVVGLHLGHLLNTIGETPNRRGLLPTAMAESRVAAQHAQLALQQPTNLAYMQTHALHVIHAIDPTIVTTGPGAGYGAKKAALAIAAHSDLAAAAPGATEAQAMHAGHVAVSARNVVRRTDQILALAQRVGTATTAAAAAALISQIVSLSDQLIAGSDANGDGRITWDQNEGGLQQCEEHAKFMLGGGR